MGKYTTKYGSRKSGATSTKYVPKSGSNKGLDQYVTNGWMVSNKQFIQISCVTTKNTQLSEKGWYGNVACTVTNKTAMTESLFWGTMQKSTGKVVINDLNLVLNPKAPNGGYTGTYLKK